MVSLTKHGATFSSLNISRGAQCWGYDEYACDTKIFLFMLETEGSIYEIDHHNQNLQEASELSDRVIERVPGNFSSQARW